jgi:hypothetical protein
MNLDVVGAFRACGGVAPAPLEPTKLQHLQGSTQSEELICQGTPSSIVHESCGASQNLAEAPAANWNSSTTAL